MRGPLPVGTHADQRFLRHSPADGRNQRRRTAPLRTTSDPTPPTGSGTLAAGTPRERSSLSARVDVPRGAVGLPELDHRSTDVRLWLRRRSTSARLSWPPFAAPVPRPASSSRRLARRRRPAGSALA